jgi:hypothetical protein
LQAGAHLGIRVRRRLNEQGAHSSAERFSQQLHDIEGGLVDGRQESLHREAILVPELASRLITEIALVGNSFLIEEDRDG